MLILEDVGLVGLMATQLAKTKETLRRLESLDSDIKDLESRLKNIETFKAQVLGGLAVIAVLVSMPLVIRMLGYE